MATIGMMRKRLHAPAGCEDYLTRRQAATVLGFASEYKIRQLEKNGLLRSVRGPMRAAFYPRPDILALKARLANADAGPDPAESWSDADLITLLGHPKTTGQQRTALDLVSETRISIQRAEQVYAFYCKTAMPSPVAATIPQPTRTAEPAAVPPGLAPIVGEAGGERRGRDRLTRDSLIRDLRHPDPRVRQHSFDRLRDTRG